MSKEFEVLSEHERRLNASRYLSLAEHILKASEAQRDKTKADVYKWGNEECPHEVTPSTEEGEDIIIHWSLKRNCDICWQELE